jgi:cilia- and flagella-associated protein 57
VCVRDLGTVVCSGHNGKVSSMAWLANDAVLISVGVDGAVYEWSIPVSRCLIVSMLLVFVFSNYRGTFFPPQDGKRFGEFLNKGVGFTGVAPNKDGSQVFATASDASTKLIDMAASAVTLEADLKTNVTALTMSSGGTMLFAGV